MTKNEQVTKLIQDYRALIIPYESFLVFAFQYNQGNEISIENLGKFLNYLDKLKYEYKTESKIDHEDLIEYLKGDGICWDGRIGIVSEVRSLYLKLHFSHVMLELVNSYHHKILMQIFNQGWYQFYDNLKVVANVEDDND